MKPPPSEVDVRLRDGSSAPRPGASPAQGRQPAPAVRAQPPPPSPRDWPTAALRSWRAPPQTAAPPVSVPAQRAAVGLSSRPAPAPRASHARWRRPDHGLAALRRPVAHRFRHRRAFPVGEPLPDDATTPNLARQRQGAPAPLPREALANLPATGRPEAPALTDQPASPRVRNASARLWDPTSPRQRAREAPFFPASCTVSAALWATGRGTVFVSVRRLFQRRLPPEVSLTPTGSFPQAIAPATVPWAASAPSAASGVDVREALRPRRVRRWTPTRRAACLALGLDAPARARARAAAMRLLAWTDTAATASLRLPAPRSAASLHSSLPLLDPNAITILVARSYALV